MTASPFTAQKIAEQREAEINRMNAIRLAQAERGVDEQAGVRRSGFARRRLRRQSAALAG